MESEVSRLRRGPGLAASLAGSDGVWAGTIQAVLEFALVELKLTLPDALARDAEAAGLLSPESIERLLREEVRRRRVDQLFDAADRLAALDLPALTGAEVEAEIRAVRAKRRPSD